MKRRSPAPSRPAIAAWSALAAGALLTSACGGPSTATIRDLNTMIAARNYAGAVSLIQSKKDTDQYGRKNAVLYYMDLGAIQHFAGQYEPSNRSLGAADDRIEQLFTISLHKEAESMLLNDKTVDYVGRPYERVLTHAIRALDFAIPGDRNDAAVEANKAEFLLDHLREVAKDTYKDDAYVRYLDSLLYEDVSDSNDARIARYRSKQAYKWYALKYNTPAPVFDLPSKKNRRLLGELVFVHYAGTAPRKISKDISIAWGQGMFYLNAARESGDPEASQQRVTNALAAGIMGNNITISYPEFVQDPYGIDASEVVVDSGPPMSSLLVENISAIAIKDLADHIDGIKAKSAVRAITKFLITRFAAKEVEKNTGQYGQLFGFLTQAAGSVISAATEVADTRSWTTLPAIIRMARLPLSPGNHQVVIIYKNRVGGEMARRVFDQVPIVAGNRTFLQDRTAL